MQQRDGALFTVRIGTTGGELSLENIQDLATLCERFDCRHVHLTVRQGIELHNIPGETMEDFLAALEATTLRLARSGPRLRSVVSCPGNSMCSSAGIDSQRIARTIVERFSHFETFSAKLKVAVSGCGNCCTRPRFNDIGIVGRGKGRYELFLGGKGGKAPAMGTSQGVYDSVASLLDTLETMLSAYAGNTVPKQRLGQWLEQGKPA